MLPLRSLAALPIQLGTLSSGSNVPSWKTADARTTRRISYQRTPATSGRASTDCFVTSVSSSPKFRYASRQVGRWRYERMSRYRVLLFTPGCGKQSRDVGEHG